MQHPENDFSRLELNLPACQENYRYFRSRLEPSTRLLVLVKANAYGHGAVEFAAMMQSCGADYLAVALPVEGMELRQAGISLPILVLTAGTDFFEEIIDNRLEPGIPNLYTLKALCEVLASRGLRDFPIHIKLDTGMHRLGFMPGELPELMDFLKDCPWVKVKSVYSHLAAAEDPLSDDFTLGQIRMFMEGAGALSDSLGYKPMWHILNSAGIERFPEAQFDMVRLGIGLHGISAAGATSLKPVVTLKSTLLQIKEIASGESVGYSRRFMAGRPTRYGVVPIGYADGWRRALGNGRGYVTVRGQRAPIIGNICMDMCTVDLTGLVAEEGDTVILMGEHPSVTEIADMLQTIPYEVLTDIAPRVKRVYYQE